MSDPKPREQVGFLFRYSLQTFGVIVVLAILIRTFFLASYVMSGSSMLPSILPGDFILASKLRVKELRRGDVVALRCPLLKNKLCLKRVVALAGDRVEFKNDALMINGVRAQYLPTGPFETEIVGDMSWAIWPLEKSGHSGAPVSVPPPPVVIPPQHVYLLNDKRSDMDDSRQWGAVTTDFVEAKMLGVWMSLDWYDQDRIRSWPHVRWGRLFRSID